MEALVALKLKDAVLVLADSSVGRSIVKMKEDEDKIVELDGGNLMAVVGEHGDRIQFADYIARNIHLYNLRNGYPLSTKAAAHYIRGELATALRRNPYNVNLLFAGIDKIHGPSVYYMDYLGSLQSMNFAVHGYAAHFLLSLLDQRYKDDMTVEEGLELLRKCVDELQQRFLISAKFRAKVVDADGIRSIPIGIPGSEPAPIPGYTIKMGHKVA
eukprot:TRINITY_DN1349_c0_g1_i1.p1 TRINITY_DN1349_c0_g1~~TRINITY_DN1349_c0_g1_i1.p1  ORF type:complete len:214 (+),score=42.60 TRINITY_DN1349_c0_g1_i1:102-743(+)